MLPFEVLHCISQKCDIQTFVNISKTCKSMKDIQSDDLNIKRKIFKESQFKTGMRNRCTAYLTNRNPFSKKKRLFYSTLTDIFNPQLYIYMIPEFKKRMYK